MSAPPAGAPNGRPAVAIIAERRHLQNQALEAARAALEGAGYVVPVVVPDAGSLFEVPTEAPPWEAVLSRGRDLAGLALLAAVSALGVPAFNAPGAVELVRNKIAMHAVLQQHGLPQPETWFGADGAVFRRVPDDRFPLVVKPFDGDGGRGLWLLERPEDTDRLPPLPVHRSLYVAQRLLETGGWDTKLYGVGSHVWAVRKRAPVRFTGPGPAAVQEADEASLVPLDARLRDLALTCGRACGLELWGVDVAVTPDGSYVIEVNDFPTYSAVPEAGARIAEHVIARVQMEALLRNAGRDRAMTLVRPAR